MNKSPWKRFEHKNTIYSKTRETKHVYPHPCLALPNIHAQYTGKHNMAHAKYRHMQKP